jgi:hypothetical protein
MTIALLSSKTWHAVQLLPRYKNGTQKFEYTKRVLRRTDNTMTNEKDKKRKYGQQNTTQTTKDWEKRTPLNNGSKL